MSNHLQFFWTLEEYRRFLQHPERLIRYWAIKHIEQQYPAEYLRAAIALVEDRDPLLRSMAIRAFGELGGPESEQKLLELLPQLTGSNHYWTMKGLGKLQSASFFPLLLEDINQIDLRKPQQAIWPIDFSPIEALSNYTIPAARNALWRLAEGYALDDRFMQVIYTGLLRHADAETVPRLVTRLFAIKPPSHDRSSLASHALAEAVGLPWLFDEVVEYTDPWSVWESVESWSDLTPEPAETLKVAFGEYNATFTHKDDEKLVQLSLAEFERVATTRGDDLARWLASWQAGDAPVGYRRRTLFTWQLLTKLAQIGIRQLSHFRKLALRNLALLGLGQYLIDENDEQRLADAPDVDSRQAALLAILASTRANVSETIEQDVAALGAVAVPALISALAGQNYWAQMRAVRTLTQLARAHPGAADAAIPAVLDFLEADEGDFANEACAESMRAFGPAIIEPIGERLPEADDHFAIYAIGTLSELPTQASVDLVEHYITDKGHIDTWDIENLSTLGHRQSMAFLRQYNDDENLWFARALYIIGLLHEVDEPRMAVWERIVHANEERETKLLDVDFLQNVRRTLATPRPTANATPELIKVDEKVRKERKKKRLQAKATQKAQRKAKKKKRR